MQTLERRVRLSEELASARLHRVLDHLNGHLHEEHSRQGLDEHPPHPAGHRVRGGLAVVQVDHQRGQHEAEPNKQQAQHQIPARGEWSINACLHCCIPHNVNVYLFEGQNIKNRVRLREIQFFCFWYRSRIVSQIRSWSAKVGDQNIEQNGKHTGSGQLCGTK